MKRTVVIIIISLLALKLNAQLAESKLDTVPKAFYLIKTATYDGKTYPQVELREIKVYAKGNRKNKFDYRKYARLVNNVKRVYPYALIVRKEMSRVDKLLEAMPGDKQRRDFLQQYEKDLFKEYEDDLSHLSYTQAKILIKLIDRETMATSYDLIREYRGKFSASFWQGIARIFGTNLKSTYDPVGEDFLIEMIIGEIDAGRL
jgi:hypothetical protein